MGNLGQVLFIPFLISMLDLQIGIVYIASNMKRVSLLDFKKADEFYRIGYEQAKKQIKNYI